MMRFSRPKMITLGLVSVGLVALAGFGTYTVLAQPPAPPVTEPITDPVPPNQKNPPSIPAVVGSTPVLADPPAAPPKIPKELLEKRLGAAQKVYQQNMTRFKAGQGLPLDLFGWSERWLDAELALAEKVADRTKALRDHLDRTREVERFVVDLLKAGQGRQADTDAATYYCLEAEIRLVKEGVEPHPAKDEKGTPEKK